VPIKAYYSSLNRKPPPIPQSELLSKLQIKSALEHKFRQLLYRPGIFGELANSLLPLAILGHRDKVYYNVSRETFILFPSTFSPLIWRKDELGSLTSELHRLGCSQFYELTTVTF
jgi:hypothetical protein